MAYRTNLRVYRVEEAVLIECDRCGPVGVQVANDTEAAMTASQHLQAHGATTIQVSDIP